MGRTEKVEARELIGSSNANFPASHLKLTGLESLVLRREPALACDVYDECDLAVELLSDEHEDQSQVSSSDLSPHLELKRAFRRRRLEIKEACCGHCRRGLSVSLCSAQQRGEGSLLEEMARLDRSSGGKRKERLRHTCIGG